MLRASVQALRPHQWVKNLLVFAPLLFTELVHSATAWLQAVLAFASFCCVASAIYLLNDVADREADQRHPKKRHRPIASGALPVRAALGLFALLLVLGIGLSLLLGLAIPARPEGGSVLSGPWFGLWPLGYLCLNLLYSFWWKHVVVIDCMCIALGFQLRVHAGAAAIGVGTSHWILLCTFFFALFLAFCKRYEEVGRQAEAAGQTRATMRDYSLPFLGVMIGPLAALSILSYALYTVSPETFARHHTYALMYTVPVVTYGVFRYLFLVYRRSEGGDPARLLFSDLPLVASGAVYVLLVVAVLHGF
jgi:4-hydroxybenzoate polyprenyltransferase